MMLSFAPAVPPSLDLLTPEEAIQVVAGVTSNDPFDPAAYTVSSEQLDEAQAVVVRALESTTVTAYVLLGESAFRRIDPVYFSLHRRRHEAWDADSKSWQVGFTLRTLANHIDNWKRNIPAEIDGRPWFIERSQLASVVATSEDVGRGPSVSTHDLRTWLEENPDILASGGVDTAIMAAAEVRFPDKTIPRSRLREVVRGIDPGRMPGPSII